MDPLERLARLHSAGAEAVRHASGARSATARGTDASEAVTISLNGDGQLSAMQLKAGWKSLLTPQSLGSAVRSAVDNAGLTRLTDWAEAFTADDSPATAPSTATASADIAGELQRLTSRRRRTDEDNSAALRELLVMAEALERGLDEATARIETAATRTHVGSSHDDHVRISVSGAGEITDVQYDERWLLEAHEYNIARQTVAAAMAAYRRASRDSARAIVEESSIGDVSRILQDPAELARRLRLSD
jgi:DNA-binding protein YbaB